MKGTATEMENSFDGLIRRLDMAEEGISQLEVMDRILRNLKAKKTKKNKPEQSI